jgi:hypothetical protein
VSFDVAVGEIIVKEVAKSFAEDNGDNGCKIDKADATSTEAIAASLTWCSEENGGSDYKVWKI